MNRKLKLVIVSAVLMAVLCCGRLTAGENLDKGLERFNKNDFENSTSYFKLAIKDGGWDELEARLWLMITSKLHSDYESFAENFAAIIEKSDNPNPYIFSMWEFVNVGMGNNSTEEKTSEILEAMNKSPKIKGLAKTWALETISSHCKSVYRFDKSLEYGKLLGGIYTWQLTGCFENISESGFNKNYAPIDHPEPDYVFMDKNKADIKWFNLIAPNEGNWISMQNNFNTRNSIVYAQTFCNSPTETDAQLRLGTSGSLKAWVNDQLVINEEEERNNGMDTYIATIHLNKGYNRILLQIGSSEIDRNNFFARITDDNETPLKNLTYTTVYQPYKKETNFKSRRIYSEVEEYFTAKMKAEPGKLIFRVLLAQVYLLNDKYHQARELLLESSGQYPESACLIDLLLETYARMEDYTNYSVVHEKLKNTVPNLPTIVGQDFDEAIKNEKHDKARGLLETYEKVSNDREKLLQMKIQLAAAENRNEDIKNYINQAYDSFPYNLNFLSLKIIYDKQLNSSQEAMLNILENYLDKYNNSLLIDGIARIYLELGKTDKYLELMNDKIEKSPEDIDNYSTLGDYYFGLRDYEKAEKYYRKCIEIAPYFATYYQDLGSSYEERSMNDKALAAYYTAIKYNPYYYSVRDKIRKLEGKKPSRDYFDEPDLIKIYNDNLSKSFEPTDHAAILCNHTNQVVYSGGASEEIHYLLIKALSKEGIDVLKEYSISQNYNQELVIEEARVLKKNGEKLKAETSSNTIVYTNLEEGDAILLIYKIQNYQFGSLSSYFWGKQPFYYYYPSLDTKFSLLINPKEKFDYIMSNSDLKPEVKNVDDWVMYTWQRKDQKKIEYEECSPVETSFSEVLDITSIPGWDVITNWYSDIYKTKARDFFEVKEALAGIFPDDTKLTEKESVKKIYNYIESKIRYSFVNFRQSGVVPQKASTTLNTRIGDCKDLSTLFVALCRAKGIDADLVLVSTNDYGKNNLPLPSTDFNHAIATVKADGKKYYVELTNDMLPFGAVHGHLIGALGLEISENNKGGLITIDPPDRMKNAIERVINVKFENERMYCDVNTVKLGGLTTHTRGTYKSKSVDEQRKTILSSINSDYPGTKLVDLSFGPELNTTDDSVTYRYSFYVDNIFNKVANYYSFKVPIVDFIYGLESLASEERKTPYNIAYVYDFDYTQDVVNITVSQGKTLVEIPQDVNIKNDFGEYRIAYKLKGDVLTVVRKLSISKDQASPGAEFDNFRKFLMEVNKNDTKLLAFTDAVVKPGKNKKKGK